MKKRNTQIAALVLILGSISCNLVGVSSKQSTLDAMSASVWQTATAQASGNQNVGVQTAQVQATAIASTLAAQGALNGVDSATTATAVAPIIAELPKYGVDPKGGQMGWIHPPATLEVKGYMKYDYINRFIATVAKDFVVSSDIYWDTQYGTSGCGFVLRSDGNKNALNQYMAILTRGASGHLVFAFMVKGKVVTGRDIYAYGKDPNFVWGNKVTNRLTVVGRGTNFEVYTNDTLIGKIDTSKPPSAPSLPDPPKKPGNVNDQGAMEEYNKKLADHDQAVKDIKADYYSRQQELSNANTVFERGFIALVVLSESGRTQCQFNNTWLWLINS